MNLVNQNMPLSIDPAGPDQSRINRQLTEMIRQLWLRQNKVEKLVTSSDPITDHSQLSSIGTNSHLDIDNFITLSDNITRITVLDSPYTVLNTDRSIYADTDGGAITVLLPDGINEVKYTVKNCGSSGNDVTLTPNGTDLLFGVNASETVFDSEVLDIQYEDTEGWR